jgi:hypothetical protein
MAEGESWHEGFPLPFVLVAFGKKNADSEDSR